MRESDTTPPNKVVHRTRVFRGHIAYVPSGMTRRPEIFD